MSRSVQKVWLYNLYKQFWQHRSHGPNRWKRSPKVTLRDLHSNMHGPLTTFRQTFKETIHHNTHHNTSHHWRFVNVNFWALPEKEEGNPSLNFPVIFPTKYTSTWKWPFSALHFRDASWSDLSEPRAQIPQSDSHIYRAAGTKNPETEVSFMKIPLKYCSGQWSSTAEKRTSLKWVASPGRSTFLFHNLRQIGQNMSLRRNIWTFWWTRWTWKWRSIWEESCTPLMR